MINKPRTVRISEIIQESNEVKTINFNIKSILEDRLIEYQEPTPGQFLMVWVPGVDEIPMSLSGFNENGNWSITVKNIGECTDALFNLKKGALIGIRGPFGQGFQIPQSSSSEQLNIVIGGGIGMAPLIPLITSLLKSNIETIVIEGVKCDEELIYKDYLNTKLVENKSFFLSTDDGSCGYKGFATELFSSIVEKNRKNGKKISQVFSCGPEIMLFELLRVCKKENIPYQASLERIMRCGFGMCGLCVLDPVGLRVCKEGPVFDSQTLSSCTDFGKFSRDFSGKKFPI